MTKSEILDKLAGILYTDVMKIAVKYGINVKVYEEELLASIARHPQCEKIIKEILDNES